MKFWFVFLLVGVFLLVAAPARGEPEAPTAICTSTGNGNWNTVATWSCGRLPAGRDEVVIAAGNVVTLDTDATISSLTISGTLTFDSDSAALTFTVTGDVIINAGGTVGTSKDKVGHVLSLGGDLANNGAFNGYQNKHRHINLVFAGHGIQAIGGSNAPAVNDLTIDRHARVVFPAVNLPNVNGSMTVNPGGAVEQTQSVNSGTTRFMQISGDKYRGVDLITANNLGLTTVAIKTVTGNGCATGGPGSPAYAARCYEITPENDLPATVRLYVLTDGQLNGINQANLRIHRYAGGSWQPLTTNTSTGSASGGYRYAQAETPGFSEFLLGGPAGPTAVTLASLAARAPATVPLPPIGLILLAGACVLVIKRRA